MFGNGATTPKKTVEWASNLLERGGSWARGAADSRSVNRFTCTPGTRDRNLGFRVALSPVAKTVAAPAPDRAVSFVESLGGKVIRDDNSPLKPVTRIDLTDTKVTDAGLKELAPLAKLEFLDLKGTRVTDAGIEELHKALPKCQIEKRPAAWMPVRRSVGHDPRGACENRVSHHLHIVLRSRPHVVAHWSDVDTHDDYGITKVLACLSMGIGGSECR